MQAYLRYVTTMQTNNSIETITRGPNVSAEMKGRIAKSRRLPRVEFASTRSRASPSDRLHCLRNFTTHRSGQVLTVVIQLVAVRWQVFRTLRRARERHKDQGGSAVVHKVSVAKASVHDPLAPTAARPLGIIVRARPSFPGSETYITACYSPTYAP